MRLSRSHIAALAILFLIAGTFLQSVLNLPYRPRFHNSAVNYWAVAVAALLMPLIVLWVASSFPRPWQRRVCVALGVLLFFPCILISSCAALDAPALADGDTSFELLDEARAGGIVYRLYRTNCGATCAFGLELREERELMVGIKLVSPLWTLYRASEGQLQLDQTSLRVVNSGAVLTTISR